MNYTRDHFVSFANWCVDGALGTKSIGEKYDKSSMHDVFHAWNLLVLMTGKVPKVDSATLEDFSLYTEEEKSAWSRYRMMIPDNDMIDGVGGPSKYGVLTHNEVKDQIVKKLAEQYSDQEAERSQK